MCSPRHGRPRMDGRISSPPFGFRRCPSNVPVALPLSQWQAHSTLVPTPTRRAAAPYPGNRVVDSKQSGRQVIARDRSKKSPRVGRRLARATWSSRWTGSLSLSPPDEVAKFNWGSPAFLDKRVCLYKRR
jgi:hypothetical protein